MTAAFPAPRTIGTVTPAKGPETKRLAALAALALCTFVGLLAASCGAERDAVGVEPLPTTGAPSGTTSGSAKGSKPTPSTTGPTETGSKSESVPPPPAEGVVTYEVWFHRGEHLFVSHRSENATPAVGRAAIEALLDGPDVHETQRDVATSVPGGTQLLGLNIAGGIATVDLTTEFETGVGSMSMFSRLGQVACTLDQFKTVTGVLFELDGEPVDVFSGEGIVLDHPVGRRDYADFLPPILVTSPGLEQQVEGPLTVEGSANVFEANVTILVEDAKGKELARTFTTATCGSGCRGTFSATVPLKPTTETHAFVILSDDDADGDGQPSFRVEVPIRLG